MVGADHLIIIACSLRQFGVVAKFNAINQIGVDASCNCVHNELRRSKICAAANHTCLNRETPVWGSACTCAVSGVVSLADNATGWRCTGMHFADVCLAKCKVYRTMRRSQESPWDSHGSVSSDTDDNRPEKVGVAKLQCRRLA